MSNPELSTVLIGKLMVSSGILNNSDLELALVRSRANGLKIGKQLLLMGMVSDLELKSVIYAQRFIRNSVLSYTDACEALSLVRKEQLSLAKALQKRQQAKNKERNTPERDSRDFGELLVQSKLLSSSELHDARDLSKANNCSLGKVLMVHNKLSPETRRDAINANILVRVKRLSFADAVQSLSKLGEKNINNPTISSNLEHDPGKNQIRFLSSKSIDLADRIIESGILSAFVTMDVLENALEANLEFEASHLDDKLCDQLHKTANESLRKLVGEGTVSMDKARTLTSQLNK